MSNNIAIQFDAIRSIYVTLSRILLFLIYIVEIFSSFYIIIKRSIIYILRDYKLETKQVIYLLINQTNNQYK